MPPTIVLVHGAFAESASWAGVAQRLHAAGHPVVAAPNPLRGVASDAAYVSDVVRTIEGPVVLVGHSYGGMVITNVDNAAGDIAALVYVSAFTPEAGESAFELSERFPGSTLGAALEPIPHADGEADLRIAHEKFNAQFCADVPAAEAGFMAATQRPVAAAALNEPSGAHPLWRSTPSYFVIGGADLNIPPELQRSLADRAGARSVNEIAGASHAVAVSHPDETAAMILEAAATVAAAA